MRYKNRPMDDVRKTLEKIFNERADVTMKGASEYIGKGDAYVQQYIKYGNPREIKEKHLRGIARYLGLSEDAFLTAETKTIGDESLEDDDSLRRDISIRVSLFLLEEGAWLSDENYRKVVDTLFQHYSKLGLKNKEDIKIPDIGEAVNVVEVNFKRRRANESGREST